MDLLGLIFELMFLGMGVYLYLFAIGKVDSSKPEMRQRAAEFRARNNKWLRPLALLLVAIMLVNVVLHIAQLISGKAGAEG
jgi:multisubunit Na+/H+ antiporter MnhC subunit